MKILQIGGSLVGSGGIEKFVLYLSDGLRARGHCVEIAAPSDSWLWNQAEARGIPVQPLRVRHKHDFTALGPCTRLLRAGGYDIVHTHFSPDYLIPALAARRTPGSRLVMTRHVVKPWKGLKGRFYGVMLYARILAVSDAVRCALLSSGIPEDRVITVHGGVPIKTEPVPPADLRAELGLAPDQVLLGIVSRIAPEKGHRPLLAALPTVLPNAVCLVVGEGPDAEAMRSYARTLGLGDRVRFLGWRTDSDAVMSALDIIVQPSLWEEACSFAIMEGMSHGKPMVVTRVGGNPELVQHGSTGLVVPKEDPSALATALNTLVSDADLRHHLGEAARLRQQEHFSVQAMTAATERAYLRLSTERT